jgi:alpha-N-arabinofuranosidase
VQLSITVTGARITRVSGSILTASHMNSTNTFDEPQAVQPRAFNGARVQRGRILLTLPARSVVVLAGR